MTKAKELAELASVTTVAGGNVTFSGQVNGRDVAADGALAAAALPKAGGAMTGNVTFGDSNKAIFGSGSDLQIFHDGSHSRIDEQGTGVLFLQTNGTSIQLNKGTSENMLVANVDGAVDLYHNNELKLATSAIGISIGTGDGSAKVSAGGTNTHLTLNGMGSSGAIIFGSGGVSNGTPGTERGRLTSSGNLGLGLSGPANILHVANSGNTRVQIDSTGNNSSGVFFKTINGGTQTGNGTIRTANDGSMQFFTGTTSDAERMRLAPGGQIAFGTEVFDISGSNGSGVAINENDGIQMFDSRCRTTSNTFRMRFFNGDDDAAKGSIRTDGNATVFSTSSDYRLKENVVYDWDATTRLKQLKPCRFNWISDDTNTAIDGFLAHEAATVVPNAVNGEKDATEVWENCVVTPSGQSAARNVTEEEWTAGKSTTTDEDGNTVAAKYASNTTWTASHTTQLMQAIDHSFLIPLLVKTIQELEARITALEA